MKIKTEKQYQNALNLINEIMKKGENNVSAKELETLQTLTDEVMKYENQHYNFSGRN